MGGLGTPRMFMRSSVCFKSRAGYFRSLSDKATGHRWDLGVARQGEFYPGFLFDPLTSRLWTKEAARAFGLLCGVH